MFIRVRKEPVDLIGNEAYSDVLARTNLYPTAYPFKSASLGNPYPIAFVAIHGVAPTVTTLTDLWGQNIVRTYPTVGFTIGVSSSAVADTDQTGTGAWKVEVDMLDLDYVPFTLTFNLNGQNKVVDITQVGRAFRINDIRVIEVGTGLKNAGDIYVYDSSDTVTIGVPQTATKIFHKALAGDPVGRGAFYTVPKGCKLQTQQVRAGITDATSANRYGSIKLNTQSPVGGKLVPKSFPITGQIDSSIGLIEVNPDFPLVFPEKTDITMQAECSGSAVVAVYIDAILFYAK